MKLCRICFCCKHCTSVVMLCCFDLLVIQTSIAQIYNAPGLEIYRFFPCYVHFHLNFCSYMFFSMYALRLPFCSFRYSQARPRHCCLQLYLGAEPEGLDPYCYCMFYYYYYYYYYYSSSFRPMGVYGSPMKGTWENDEIWHTCRDGYE